MSYEGISNHLLVSPYFWLYSVDCCPVIDKQENTNRTKVQNEHEENMKALEIQERRMELENKRLSMPQSSPALNPYLTKPDFN